MTHSSAHSQPEGSTPCTKFQQEFAARRNEDGGVVLDINRGKIFSLNGLGALIFERLREQQNESQIVEEISQQFDISVETVRADFIEFVRSLEKQGLVTVGTQSSS